MTSKTRRHRQWVGRVGVYGWRRRGDARSDPKCLDLCVHCMCGCSNPLPHRSFPFIPPLSLSLCLSLLSKVTAILIVCSQAGIAALFFSVGGPCETLQCKYLFCCLIHFFGSFLLEAASVFFSPSQPMNNSSSYKFRREWIGKGCGVSGWCLEGSNCSMWFQMKSLAHVHAVVFVSALHFYGFVLSQP